MLRCLTENVCGELRLPDYELGKGGVVYLCASNAVELWWSSSGVAVNGRGFDLLW